MAYTGPTSNDINLDELIVPAKEAKKLSRFTYLLIGGPGGGKSATSLTIPSDHSAIHLDFDGKTEHIKAASPDNVSIVDLVVNSDDAQKQALIVEQILKAKQEGRIKQNWIFLDSLTSIFQLYSYEAHRTLGGSPYRLNYDKQDYVKGTFWKTLLKCFGLFEYTVLTAHETARQDVEGNTIIQPLAVKQLSEGLAGRFQNFFHATNKGGGDEVVYVWETRPSGIYQCNTAIPNLPYVVPNHFDLILSTKWEEVPDVKTAVKLYQERTGRKLTRWDATKIK
jgi:hypothetical protein